MSESHSHTPAISETSLAAPEQLEPLSVAAISALIEEADQAQAFMPSATKPEQTMSGLLDKFQNDPRFQIFGYAVDGHAASFIVALSHGADADTLSIGPMYVGADHRGQGLGRRQVVDFIDIARDQGYQQVYTKTWSGNAASRRIFEDPAIGFRHIETVSHDRANGDDSLGYLLDV